MQELQIAKINNRIELTFGNAKWSEPADTNFSDELVADIARFLSSNVKSIKQIMSNDDDLAVSTDDIETKIMEVNNES